LVAVYERLLVEGLNGALHVLGAALGIPSLLRADLRGDNFAIFGLALYLATLLQARVSRPDAPHRGQAQRSSIGISRPGTGKSAGRKMLPGP
jgi:hypothetical protein